MDTELAYTPVTQAYGHSHESQYIILACCANHISAECCQWRGGGVSSYGSPSWLAKNCLFLVSCLL